MFLVFGSEFRSSMVFSFIFSVRPISRRNIAIKIISSIQSEAIKRYSKSQDKQRKRVEIFEKLHFDVCACVGREEFGR